MDTRRRCVADPCASTAWRDRYVRSIKILSVHLIVSVLSILSVPKATGPSLSAQESEADSSARGVGLKLVSERVEDVPTGVSEGDLFRATDLADGDVAVLGEWIDDVRVQ